MNTLYEIISIEIERTENMLANYVGQAHGTIELELFQANKFENVSDEVKRIVLAMQVLPRTHNPTQELAARYLNLADSLAVAVAKPRMPSYLLRAYKIENFLSDNIFCVVVRHVALTALVGGAVMMPSLLAQVICLIAMLSAGLAGSYLNEKNPVKGIVVCYISCMAAYAIGALLANNGQATMGASAAVMVVTAVIGAASIIKAFISSLDDPDPFASPYTHNPAVEDAGGMYIDLGTAEITPQVSSSTIKLG